MMGCLFFFTCLVTYKESSYKIGMLEELNLCSMVSWTDETSDPKVTYQFDNHFECIIDRYTSEY